MKLIRSFTLMILPLIFSCAGGNFSLWKPYSFDGSNFLPSINSTSKAIWLRNGHLPMTSETHPETTPSTPLPLDYGAVAGICFLQTTGGRISERNLFTPYPDEQITFRSKVDGVSVTRTDKSGYFTEALPPGDYELFCRGVRSEFTVKKGETTLVPIRGGKRMAD